MIQTLTRFRVYMSSRLPDGLAFSLAVWGSVRLLLSLWGAWNFANAPQNLIHTIQATHPEWVIPQHDLAGYLVGIWNLYDTYSFVTIAEQGYNANAADLYVFFPGYPLLIAGARLLLFGNSLLAALIVANLATIFYFWYLYRLVKLDYDRAIARRTVIIAAIFPSAFFLFLAYTEPVLLAFAVGAIYHARLGQWARAGLLAAGAALTKQPGILLVLPLAYLYWQQTRQPGNGPAQTRWKWIWIAVAPVGGAAYLLYSKLYLAAADQGLADLGGQERFTIPGEPLLRAISQLNTDNPQLILHVIDTFFAGLLIVGLLAVLRWARRPEYLLYVLPTAILSLAVTWSDIYRPVVNMPRRALILFPIFIVLGRVTGRPRIFILVLSSCLILFLVLSSLFVNWIFIS